MAGVRKDELHRLYERQAQAPGFAADAAQAAAIDKLESLRGGLIRREAAERSVTSRVLRTLGGTTPQAPRGVYLHGGVGRGKTWLMDLFFQSLPFERKLRSHFHRFMHDIHARLKGISQQSDPLHQVAATIAEQTRVICFDELFVSDIADAMILGSLFRHFIDQGVALVVTSNVPPAALYREGLQRQRFLPAIALLEKHTETVAVDGTVDYRLRQLTQAEIYLASAAADTSERLYQIFEDLADGPGDVGGTLMIAGRPIDFVRESENVVWFEFLALCDGPRSQSDYIELAREYQSVIVANIPVLGTASDNAARRFVALVDEFYDRGVKLIVSAAATPGELYRGERLQFDFRRTISRLTEMQTREYLACEHLP